MAFKHTAYEHNQVYRSSLTGQFYFAPKVRLLGGGVAVVVGKKYDITAQLKPFLLKKFRRPAALPPTEPER